MNYAKIAEAFGWTEFFRGEEFAVWCDEPVAARLLERIGDANEITAWVADLRRRLLAVKDDADRYSQELRAAWLRTNPKAGLTREGIAYLGGRHVLVAKVEKSNPIEIGRALLLRGLVVFAHHQATTKIEITCHQATTKIEITHPIEPNAQITLAAQAPFVSQPVRLATHYAKQTFCTR